jgi:hypothetical protein
MAFALLATRWRRRLAIVSSCLAYDKGEPGPPLPVDLAYVFLLPFLNLLRQLKRLDVCCLPALRPLNDVELHCLTFLQTLEAIRIDGRVMHEYILPVLAGDEAVALCVVKPLHSTLFHLMLIPGVNCAGVNLSQTGNVLRQGRILSPGFKLTRQ